MAVPSTMLPLGTSAPDFSLPDATTGEAVSLADFEDKPVVLVMFISNHCPYVKHVAAELARIGSEYRGQGVGVVAIGSNDIENYPDDAPPRMIDLPANIGTRTDMTLTADYLRGKWTLVYIGDAQCDEVCLQNFYKMRQVRLAQNENVRRVQRLFLLTGKEIPEALSTILEKYPGMEVALLSPDQAGATVPLFEVDGLAAPGSERVYLVDPLGYLMMYYAPDAEPKGMLNDLKKLLKYSRFG